MISSFLEFEYTFELDLTNDLVYIKHITNQEVIEMPVKVNIYEAKSKFSKLISQAIAGEEIIIAKSGKPVAKLVPFEKPLGDRKPGSAKGKIIMSDDFDAPLPDDILKEFYK